MKKVIIEICCNSAQDVLAAARSGADRVELTSAISLGGLTPTLGELIPAKRSGIPVMCMLRPRSGGFCYTESEFETMLIDAETLVNAGADGIVFAILNSDGTIDKPRSKQILDVIGDVPAVCHRAFDVTPNWREALDDLCELGFRRILTGGQAGTAMQGVATLADMQEYAAGRIEIMPGGGVTAENAAHILTKTGCTHIHIALDKAVPDNSCAANPLVSFNGSPCAENAFIVTNEAAVAEFVHQINQHNDR